MNFDEAIAKAAASLGISVAVMAAMYSTHSEWCLWALWLVVLLFAD